MVLGLLLVAVGAWMLWAGVTRRRRRRDELAAALDAEVAACRSRTGPALSSDPPRPVVPADVARAESRLRELLAEPVVARCSDASLTPDRVHVGDLSYPLEEDTTATVHRGGDARRPKVFMHLASPTWAKVVHAGPAQEARLREMAAQVPVMAAQVPARRAALARAREDLGAASAGLPVSLDGPEHERYRPPTGPGLPLPGTALVFWGTVLLLWGLVVLL